MDPAKSDPELVRRCLRNEPEAFGHLMDRYKNRVFSLIYRMVQNPADAEDLAQESFLKAFRNLSSYDLSRPFLTWLFKITHNTTIDFLRARKPFSLSIQQEKNLLELEDSQSPLADLETASDKERAEKLMSSLPPLYREVLVLRHREELDYVQIGKILEIPAETVKIRLFRARDLMRRKWEAGWKPKNKETLSRPTRSLGKGKK